jgi:hypothetical protein
MIDKLDYWFLDIALERFVGINDVVPDRQGFLSINRNPLDINLIKMAEILDKLLKQEYLIAFKPYGTIGGSTPTNLVKFIPSKNEILQGLQIGATPEIIEYSDGTVEKYGNSFNFQLTPKGGAIWESISYPKWELYFNSRYTKFGIEGNELLIESANKNLIRKIIAVEHLLDNGGLQNQPMSGKEKWETISPFKLPYWKTSPSGHRLCYEVLVNEIDLDLEDLNQTQEFITQRNEARAWYENICSNWYTNYFKNSENRE